MLFFKRQEKIFNYAKYFHKTFFDVTLQKAYLNNLSTSPEFHLEDAFNYSNYIKVSDSHVRPKKFCARQKGYFQKPK